MNKTDQISEKTNKELILCKESCSTYFVDALINECSQPELIKTKEVVDEVFKIVNAELILRENEG